MKLKLLLMISALAGATGLWWSGLEEPPASLIINPSALNEAIYKRKAAVKAEKGVLTHIKLNTVSTAQVNAAKVIPGIGIGVSVPAATDTQRIVALQQVKQQQDTLAFLEGLNHINNASTGVRINAIAHLGARVFNYDSLQQVADQRIETLTGEALGYIVDLPFLDNLIADGAWSTVATLEERNHTHYSRWKVGSVLLLLGLALVNLVGLFRR